MIYLKSNNFKEAYENLVKYALFEAEVNLDNIKSDLKEDILLDIKFPDVLDFNFGNLIYKNIYTKVNYLINKYIDLESYSNLLNLTNISNAYYFNFKGKCLDFLYYENKNIYIYIKKSHVENKLILDMVLFQILINIMKTKEVEINNYYIYIEQAFFRNWSFPMMAKVLNISQEDFIKNKRLYIYNHMKKILEQTLKSKKFKKMLKVQWYVKKLNDDELPSIFL